jgi:hypothetical protein
MGDDVIWKYLLAWIPMVFLAIANGALREFTYAKHASELRAHQISTATGITLFAVYLWFLFRRWPAQSAAQAGVIGLLFLVLTVAFEFGFGHFVAGHSWSQLLQGYNLAAGRVWALVLVFVTIAPYLLFRIQS